MNYIAHAATVLTRPGERADDYLVSVIGSLLFPSLGLYRGIEAILCGAVFVRNDDLTKAARSGALCVVVRGADWRPQDGGSIGDVVLKRGEPPEVKDAQDIEAPANGRSEKEGERQVHIIPYSPPYMFNKFGCPVSSTDASSTVLTIYPLDTASLSSHMMRNSKDRPSRL